MDGQRKRARGAEKGADAVGDAMVQFARDTVHPTEFLGYERDDLYTVIENMASCPTAEWSSRSGKAPSTLSRWTDSGSGTIDSDNGKVAVDDVQQHGQVQVVIGRVIEGTLEVGTRVKAALLSRHRHDVAANHTATHLLHYALRTRLGKDVTQAGSSVQADKFRFDFAYHEPSGQNAWGDRGARQPSHRREPSGAHVHHHA